MRKLIKSIQYYKLKYHMKLQAVTTPDEKNGNNRFTVKTFHIVSCLHFLTCFSKAKQQTLNYTLNCVVL